MTKIIDNEKAHLQNWWDANSRPGTRDNKGYVIGEAAANVFGTLPDEVWGMFRDGDGNELAQKMKALHSSSALGLNVLGHWAVSDDCGPLQRSLELKAEIQKICFEKKFENGLNGRTNPNLDMALYLSDGTITAIESKYLEPMNSHKRGLKPAYFEHRGRPLSRWSNVGLGRHQELAETLKSGEDRTYRRLHAEQLLKHALGLGHARMLEPDAPHRPSKLIYLYFELEGPQGDEHRADVMRYAAATQGDWLDFQPITYQDLYRNLLVECEDSHSHRSYLAYLGSRYFNRLMQTHC